MVCDDSILATVSGTLIFIGWLISSFIFGYVSDRFGRKVAFLYAVINISVVPLAGAFANSLWLFTIFRFFVGTGIGKDGRPNHSMKFVCRRFCLYLVMVFICTCDDRLRTHALH